ncbi:MAG: hypothetical protein OEW69_09350, partial [Nitrospirota bacterium]|nr:hypothetical protein [Nitrospirota bacterium]
EPISNEKGENPSGLEEILKRCAEYCEKLESSVLFFVCYEKIKEEIYQYPQGKTMVIRSSPERSASLSSQVLLPRPKRIVNNYIYDYQLIKKKDKIEESRTLLEENGKEKHEKNARLKTKRFYSERSAFGPVGFLSRDWQDMYSYTVIKEKTSYGRKVLVLEAKPKQKIKDKPNYGKIWVDKEDFSIIRIEIEQESLAGFEQVEEERRGSAKPVITVTHDYAIIKNGLRFPSQTTFKEEYDAGMGSLIKSRIHITYDNYRFFTVEVEVKY